METILKIRYFLVILCLVSPINNLIHDSRTFDERWSFATDFEAIFEDRAECLKKFIKEVIYQLRNDIAV